MTAPGPATAGAAGGPRVESRAVATPEEQIELYRAARDGDVAGMVVALSGGIDVNVRLDALWHVPGPEATVLHVAVAAAQVGMVDWLLAAGADAARTAAGRRPSGYIGAAGPYEGAWAAARPSAAEEIRALLARPWPGVRVAGV